MIATIQAQFLEIKQEILRGNLSGVLTRFADLILVALVGIMIGLMAGQHRRIVRQVMDLKLRTATQRLGCFLLRLIDANANGATASLPFAKATLASRLGMTPENLSRAFRALEPAGIDVDGSRVIYVVERNGMYPTWNKAAWRVMSRVDFAQHVDREVLCR